MNIANVLLGELVARLTGHKFIPDELLFSQKEQLVASVCNQAQDMSVIVYSTQTWKKVASFTFEEDVSIMWRMRGQDKGYPLPLSCRPDLVPHSRLQALLGCLISSPPLLAAGLTRTPPPLPPLPVGQTNKVKTLPSGRTT